MINFKPLGKNVLEIKNYLMGQNAPFCDLSLGVKYIWRNDFRCEYAIVQNTLILKESTPEYSDAFYYPIGENVESALQEIENYCKQKGIELKFCCIDNVTASELATRYPLTEIFNERNWSDYIYDANAFKTFKGKKYSGQRNHINKFKKTYQNCSFSIITPQNLQTAVDFINEQTAKSDFSMWTEKAEAQNLTDYVNNAFRLGQVGGMVCDGNKVIGVSFGERIGDTLIVHVEKADRNYQGVYPYLANAFASAFAVDGVKFINREEDCGDMGLRISKLQYHPIEVKEKNFVKVKTLFDGLVDMPTLITERLEISYLQSGDIDEYYKLYTDQALNKYWGYDYKNDLSSDPTPQDFYDFALSLRQKREELSFAVRLKGKMIGELVAYNFGYQADCEVGYRFFSEHHGKGYAVESAKALLDYIFGTLKANKTYTRCFKQNTPSHNLAIKLGYTQTREDQTHYYFEKILR